MGQNFLVDQFLKGGPMMWALLLCSLVALGIVFDRVWHLMRVPSEEQAEQELDAAEDVLKNQGEKGAVDHFRQGSGVLNFIFAALVKRYDVLVLENRNDLEDMRQELIEATQEAGDIFLGRLLNALGTIGVLCPLIGLLGTILGMIRAFDAIARSGAGDPAAVASGISEALITTATGLIVAIPTIVFHRYLSGRAEKVFRNIELYGHTFANTLLVRFQTQRQA
jgi:biopolymer transport protein ExbB